MIRMGADVEVLAVDRAVGDVAHETRAEAVVVLLADRLVDLAPPDLRLARRLADDELVLRRAAGVLPGADDERSVRRDDALPVADGMLVELCRREVAVRRVEVRRGIAKLGRRHGLLLASARGRVGCLRAPM
jgi:hypothetical protein